MYVSGYVVVVSMPFQELNVHNTIIKSVNVSLIHSPSQRLYSKHVIWNKVNARISHCPSKWEHCMMVSWISLAFLGLYFSEVTTSLFDLRWWQGVRDDVEWDQGMFHSLTFIVPFLATLFICIYNLLTYPLLYNHISSMLLRIVMTIELGLVLLFLPSWSIPWLK